MDSVKAFIFDCDGVIWKGDSVIPGVPETLDMLRAKVYFLSLSPVFSFLCRGPAASGAACRRGVGGGGAAARQGAEGAAWNGGREAV